MSVHPSRQAYVEEAGQEVSPNLYTKLVASDRYSHGLPERVLSSLAERAGAQEMERLTDGSHDRMPMRVSTSTTYVSHDYLRIAPRKSDLY